MRCNSGIKFALITLVKVISRYLILIFFPLVVLANGHFADLITTGQPSNVIEVQVEGTAAGDINGKPIYLMDASYNLLKKSNIQHGKVQFDLSGLKLSGQELIIISPTTGDEMAINLHREYPKFVIDNTYIQKRNGVKLHAE